MTTQSSNNRGSGATLSQLVEAAEAYYAQQGYVKWADLARDFGISRQAVQFRFSRAVQTGLLSPADLARYQTVSSRRKDSARRAQMRKLTTFQVSISEENAVWLKDQAERRRVRKTDIIDGLISRARQATSGL